MPLAQFEKDDWKLIREIKTKVCVSELCPFPKKRGGGGGGGGGSEREGGGEQEAGGGGWRCTCSCVFVVCESSSSKNLRFTQRCSRSEAAHAIVFPPPPAHNCHTHKCTVSYSPPLRQLQSHTHKCTVSSCTVTHTSALLAAALSHTQVHC